MQFPATSNLDLGYIFNKKFILITDGSNQSLIVVLARDGHLLIYSIYSNYFPDDDDINPGNR